jgi:hypothetical protein
MSTLRQLRNSAPSPDQARDLMDRAHAVYAITRSLDGLRLGNWTHPLISWLGNYDGLEGHIPPEDDPVINVRDLLARYLTQGRIEIGLIAVDLSTMRFLHHRAAWIDERKGQRRNWMPLQQPWLDFVTHGEVGDDLRLWQSEKPWPPSEQVRHHLLAGYVRQNGLR